MSTPRQPSRTRRAPVVFHPSPDSTAYIVAGPALELLDREHGRLPAIFYHVFTGALNKWVRIYEYRDAEDRVEMLREWAEGDEEQYEIADVAGSVPDCMKRSRSVWNAFGGSEWKPGAA